MCCIYIANVTGAAVGANSSGSKRAKRTGYFAARKLKHVGIEDLKYSND
jgi:hypothetical protein